MKSQNNIKTFIILVLIILCFSSCIKSNELMDTSTVSTTQSNVTTNEINNESETISDDKQTLFTDHNFECDYDNYREEGCTTFTYKIKVKLPNNWETICINFFEDHDNMPHVGIQIFNGPLPEYFEPVGGTVFIAESSNGFNDYNGDAKNDYYEFFITTNGYKLRIYYDDQKKPVYIQFLDYSSLCVFLRLEETQDIQEIVNIINSIEIIDKIE